MVGPIFLANRLATAVQMGGRHLVDIIGDISWTKEVTSRGQFW